MNIPAPEDLFDSFRKIAINPESTDNDVIKAIIKMLQELDGRTAENPTYSEAHGQKRILSQTERDELLIQVGQMYEFTKNNRHTSLPDNLKLLLTNWGLLKD